MPSQALIFLCSTMLVFEACNGRREDPPDNMRTLPVESITVAGVLIDTWCYTQNDESGRAPWPPRVDTLCSSRSVELGYPVAVVVDSKTVWVLSESPKIFAKFLNDSVRVSGDIRSEGVLIPRTFERKSEEAWQRIF